MQHFTIVLALKTRVKEEKHTGLVAGLAV